MFALSHSGLFLPDGSSAPPPLDGGRGAHRGGGHADADAEGRQGIGGVAGAQILVRRRRHRGVSSWGGRRPPPLLPLLRRIFHSTLLQLDYSLATSLQRYYYHRPIQIYRRQKRRGSGSQLGEGIRSRAFEMGVSSTPIHLENTTILQPSNPIPPAHEFPSRNLNTSLTISRRPSG